MVTDHAVKGAESGGPPAPTGIGKRLGALRQRRSAEGSLTVLGFLLLFAVYGIWLGSGFLNVDARVLDIHSNVPILLLGLAVLVTLVPGMFDLSVAGMCTLTTFLTIGLTTTQGWPFGVVLAVCLGIGILGGLINGVIVEVFRVNAFIATLGTSGVFTGASAIYSGGTQVVPQADGPQIPSWFADLGSYGTKFPSVVTWLAIALLAVLAFRGLARVKPAGVSHALWRPLRVAVVAAAAAILVLALDLPAWVEETSWFVAILLIVALVLWVLLQYTTLGRHLQAIGSNRPASRLAGIPVRRQVITSFVLGGTLAALAGVLLAANQGSAAPDVAASFLLPAFAAAFLSTVVFSTGHHTVWGTVVGGTFVVWVGQGLIVGGLPPTWTILVNGVVLIAAVAMSTLMRRAR